MTMRYRIDFPDGAVCSWHKRNPGYIPIVDMGTPFVLGVCIALADNPSIAEHIVALLNGEAEADRLRTQYVELAKAHAQRMAKAHKVISDLIVWAGEVEDGPRHRACIFLRELKVAPPALTPDEQKQFEDASASGMSPKRWAEGLIRQLPEDHDGRNSWLLNHGEKEETT